MIEELFIVEGVSARSTLQQAIDKQSQLVHALQGKLANVSKMSDDGVAANSECQKLITAVNQHPYSHILVLMDPDIDGVHSSALLLSFFARYCQPMIEQGLLSMIKPPLYRVIADGSEPVYAWNEAELGEIEATYTQPIVTTRFKGIAQFSTNECVQLLLAPATRRQYRLSL